MKTASVSRLKAELDSLPPAEVRDICMKLARYRTESKELLTYLLFYPGDEDGYIRSVKEEIDLLFAEINTSHLYFVRKTVRKITRVANKYIRFSGNRQTEVELRLYLCFKLKQSHIPLDLGSALGNLYAGQLQKIRKAVSLLHEDLQHDYQEEMEKLGL
ncbi:MAG: hypothetical protein FD166_2513 [Bacteroidetes bacterium]|nr:MAG: hypothetical protein FD166_2513 [Bacteroidota bacterium]